MIYFAQFRGDARYIHVLWPIFIKDQISDRLSSLVYRHLPALAVNAMLLVAANALEFISAEDDIAIGFLQER